MSFLSSLARGGFSVWEVNRRPGLGPTTAMTDLAADYARAISTGFSGPADVLGVSTGGSVALRFALDHPGLVRRLAVACAALRLSGEGREVRRRMAELAAGGSTRRALAQLAPAITGSPVGRSLARGLLWAFAPALVGPGWDPSDMVATIRAEYAFDVGDELGGISAPTLVVGGDRDPFYPPEMFAETARRVPNARLVLYEGRGHAGALYDRRYAGDVAPFLGLEASPP